MNCLKANQTVTVDGMRYDQIEKCPHHRQIYPRITRFRTIIRRHEETIERYRKDNADQQRRDTAQQEQIRR